MFFFVSRTFFELVNLKLKNFEINFVFILKILKFEKMEIENLQKNFYPVTIAGEIFFEILSVKVCPFCQGSRINQS